MGSMPEYEPTEDTTQYNVTKYGAYIPVNDDLLDLKNMYQIKLTRRQRIKTWISHRIWTARRRLGEWIAGESLDCDHDDW